MCDHTTVMHNGSLIHESELSQHLKNEAYGWTNSSRIMASLKRKPKDAKNYRPLDFLDRRKGYMRLFSFCPYCGEKINWKEIKRGIKNETL